MTLVIIDNQKVANMLASPVFRNTFTFLSAAQTQAAVQVAKLRKKKCDRCSRKTRAVPPDYSAIRKTIATMDDGLKAKMKRMLGAKQVQVDYTNANGKKIRLRF